MIASEREVDKRDGLTLLDVPISCVKSVICGPRASKESVDRLQKEAKASACQFLQMRIGRSTGVPYFDNLSGRKFSFSGEALVPVISICQTCGEPIKIGFNHCSWCLIENSHRNDAARRNSIRLLHHYGILDSYMEGIRSIESGTRR